jgi:hypothetical protein
MSDRLDNVQKKLADVLLKVPTAHGPDVAPAVRSARADAEAAILMATEAEKHPDPELAKRLAEIQIGRAEAEIERLEKAVG